MPTSASNVLCVFFHQIRVIARDKCRFLAFISLFAQNFSNTP
ncbi:hypothetical protein FDUTEX481_03757 [Tolypothrix sp. PCC 7601]|nr:hypothetical protein FDUTEX481_03757 [Tolypothrix sp. PCC 7601]